MKNQLIEIKYKQIEDWERKNKRFAELGDPLGENSPSITIVRKLKDEIIELLKKEIEFLKGIGDN